MPFRLSPLAVPSVLAVVAGWMGAVVALHHPLWPGALTLAFVAASVGFFLRPDYCPIVLPALLPLGNWSPWTGWLAMEEFDLFVLAAVAGGNARFAVSERFRTAAVKGVGDTEPAPSNPNSRLEQLAGLCWLLLGISWLLACGRGLVDAGGLPKHWFEGYEEPLNTVRVAKSFLFVLLLLPLVRWLLRAESDRFARGLVVGVACGLALVSVAVVWERAGHPGLVEFSIPYRATALFWEMHVGGAAVDGFLVLALPFAVCATRCAPTFRRWLLAASLSLLASYACLTTFSRVVYGGVLLTLGLLVASLSAPPWSPRDLLQANRGRCGLIASPPRWRKWGNRGLLLLVAVEAAVVIGLGDFMRQRLSSSEHDLGGRLQHWREAVSLLDSATALLFGKGMGRFPAVYSQTVAERQMPGRLSLVDDTRGSHLALQTPATTRRQGTFELLQRIPLAGDSYLLTMDVRAPSVVNLGVGVCRRHLLYDAACVRGELLVTADDAWRRVAALLAAERLAVPWWQPFTGFLTLRLEDPAATVEIDNLSLRDASGRNLIANGSFSSGMAHWYFASRHDFLPWHVDNLLLEVLIEQGVLGLVAFLGVLVAAIANLLVGRGHDHWLAPYLLAAIASALAIGLLVSLLDMPRTAFLFFLLVGVALSLDGRRSSCRAGDV